VQNNSGVYTHIMAADERRAERVADLEIALADARAHWEEQNNVLIGIENQIAKLGREITRELER
jgi:hypothetical protein